MREKIIASATRKILFILVSMMVNAVPEPTTLLLFVSGLLGVRV